jgi:hypothetical protein
MFKTSWFKPGVILSDEGFSVLPKRDRLLYREGKRTMTVTVDMGVNGFTIFLASIARWDDNLGESITPEKAREIAGNIRRALESQEQKVDFVRCG